MAEDSLTYTGLTTKTNNELVSELQAKIQEIYSVSGEQINFDSNTPDGNLTEVISQLGTTLRELITEVYNCGDPAKCNGAVQDKMYQINYLTRRAGTFTRQNIAITTTKTVTLQGLDGSYNDVNASSYTVSDNAGNLWYLIDTTTLQAGTTSCPFRAKELGEVIPTIGTITNQVTIVGGVTSVINNVGYTILGENEESDSEFRIRRERSVANSSENNYDTTIGNLLALDGVTAVNGDMNVESTTNANGTLPHYVWYIVGGGANTEIAQTIYTNLGGTGTRGSVSVPITTINGQSITINFDRPTIKPLYIKFDLYVTGDLGEINQSDIKTYIANNLTYNVGENAETSKVTQVCANAIDADGGGAYALNVLISAGGTATASIGSSTGITSASVVSSTFQDKAGDTTASYTFSYTADGWKLSGNVVNLTDYGISFVGTPVVGDEISISFTAGTYTNVVNVTSIADQFVTDTNKIKINIPNQGS